MAKTKVQEWDGTASNNTDIDSVNIAENCSPAGINDAIREVMAHIATALSGADDKIITGTPGTTGQLGAWNVDGDLIAATAINSLAIGNTTPAVGAFTTLSASGTLTASGSFAFGGTTFTGVTGADVTFVSGTAGTDGNLVQWNTDGDVVDGPDVETTITDTDSAVPTSGAVVDYVAARQGSAAPVATTSGATVNISTAIPSGVRRIEVVLEGVSGSGSNDILVQLSTGAAFVTSGYVSGSEAVSNTTGLVIDKNGASGALYGCMTLIKEPSTDTWHACHVASVPGTGSNSGAGAVDVGGTLDGVRLAWSGSDTFDAGAAFLRYYY